MTKVILLKGKKALLLAEACKLDKEKKSIKKKLTALKEKMKIKSFGTFKNEANDQVVISEVDKVAPIDPKKVFFYMKNNNLRAEFWKCIKIQLKELNKQVPEKKIKCWKRIIGSTKRWTFK